MIRRFAAVLVLACVSIGPARADTRLHQVSTEDWAISCWPGSDDFAVNCVASAKTGDLTLRLSAADSQIYASVERSGCAALGQENFWRDELLALSPARRRHKVEHAFGTALRDLAASCPVVHRARLKFVWLPDVAIVGDPPPAWAVMRSGPPEE